MIEAVSGGFVDAADFTEYLVLKKNFEFRTAHQLVGQLVRKGLEKGCGKLADLSIEEIREIIPDAEEDVFKFIDIKNAVARRLYNKS
jgi:argininosuccinate lyase